MNPRRKLMEAIAKWLGYRAFPWALNTDVMVWCKVASEALSIDWWGASRYKKLPGWLQK